MRTIIFIAGLLAGSTATAAMAQSTDRCSDVLRDGTFQTASYRENSYFQQIIYSRFASSTYEQSKNDTTLGFGVPVGKLIFKGDYNESQFNQKRQDIQRTMLNIVNQTNEMDTALASGDSTIVNAWTKCMQSAGGRLALRFIPVGPTTIFTEINWIPGRAGDTTGVVRTKILETVSLPIGTKFRQGAECFRRNARITENVCRSTIDVPNAAEALAFSVNAEHGSAQAYLPPRLVLKREEKPYEFKSEHTLRLVGHRGETSDTRTARLSDEERNAGWRFDPTTARMKLDVVKGRWVHYCDQEKIIADLYSFEFGFRAVGVSRNKPDRNTSITCTARPAILMTKESWVPAGTASADRVEDPLKSFEDSVKSLRVD